MARLFGKEYHEHSNTWYFKNTIISLAQTDLRYKHHLNESGQVVFVFEAVGNVSRRLSGVLTIVYDKVARKIVSFHEANCQDKDICPFFLSVLLYAYRYLTTDILSQSLFRTHQTNLLNFNEFYQREIINSRILLSGLFDQNNNKIRFHLKGYKRFNIPLISLIAAGKEIKEADKELLPVIHKQINSFTEEELELFAKLQTYKCAYSNKNMFFSVYKRDFIKFFSSLRSLSKIYIQETGDKLVFSEDTFAINFIVEPYKDNSYIIRLSHGQQLSAVYAGRVTYIFKRNLVYRVHLPFNEDIIRQIFSEGYVVKEEDLIYLVSVVTRQLSMVNCYLDFNESIVLPEVIDNTPTVTFNLFLAGIDIVMQGMLVYDEDHKVPLSVLRFPSELVKMESQGSAWYYISPRIRYQVGDFFQQLPPHDNTNLDDKSELVFRGINAIDNLKKTVFEKSRPEWDIKLSAELKDQFIYKVILEPQIKADKKENIDWFEYMVSYSFKDITITHGDLKKFFKTGEKFLKLTDGRLLYFSNKETFNEIERFLVKSEDKKNEIYHMNVYNIPYLYQLAENNPQIHIAGDTYLNTMYNAILKRATIDKQVIPSMFRAVMRNYQKSGFHWLKMMQHYQLGGILADDMGLGKTVQAISLISSLAPGSISVVICPKTLLFNWAAEIAKFNPALRYITYEGGKEERLEMLKNIQVSVILASYSIIQNDLEELQKIKFDYIVLDEAQHIKNPAALRTKAIKKLNSRWKVALTGTPMENSPTEIWSIFDFLMQGYLPSQRRFKTEYLSDLIKSDERKKRLASLFSPFVLRRKKHDVLIELPDKQEQLVYCKLSELQEKLYMQILDSTRENYLEKTENKTPGKYYLHILAALTRLRQICNHPALVENDIKTDMELSGKTELLFEIISDAVENGQKLLIFSQFVKMLKILKEMLDKANICHEYMDGSTKNRERHVNNFNNNETVRAFLISLKTGGAGLNLTAADTVILVDPWWNPMGENQAVDRAHRIGQTKKVMVYKVIAKGTIEEKIVALQQNKKEMFEHLIEGGQGILQQMDADDLKSLFEY